MLVTIIRATVRVSRGDSEHGWRTIELGADANIYPGENWQNAQQDLYAELNDEAMALLGNGHNGHSNGAQQPTTSTSQPTAEAQGITVEGWCPIHNLQMRKHTKGNTSWYSHQLPDGTWCRGK